MFIDHNQSTADGTIRRRRTDTNAHIRHNTIIGRPPKSSEIQSENYGRGIDRFVRFEI